MVLLCGVCMAIGERSVDFGAVYGGQGVVHAGEVALSQTQLLCLSEHVAGHRGAGQRHRQPTYIHTLHTYIHYIHKYIQVNG